MADYFIYNLIGYLLFFICLSIRAGAKDFKPYDETWTMLLFFNVIAVFIFGIGVPFYVDLNK